MSTNNAPTKQSTKVVDLRPTTNPSLQVVFIVLEKGKIQNIYTRDESNKQVETPTCTALVADETACCNLQLYGSAEVEYVQVRDIVRLNQGIFSWQKKQLLLRAGRRGIFEKLGEFTMVFSEAVNMSHIGYKKDEQGNYQPAQSLPAHHWAPPA
uniref:Nucleic acid-ob-fold-like protein isoform 1 n=1 Tax=Tetraselmis sp. GSL018 TaxID=582737 RepID=A0A061QSS2_9CHLO|mmetsp:Transcript_35271/g.83674  ORF Transcript_35271/g.83674 Transcript_35271/m.83674 type:complete len:154 (+) Transcript_35271:733-1194(+)